jgi:hypothetical protein
VAAAKTTAKIQILVPPELKRWLEAHARAEDRTLSRYCLRVLEHHRARMAQGAAAGPKAARTRAPRSMNPEPEVIDSGRSHVRQEVERLRPILGWLLDKQRRDLVVRGLVREAHVPISAVAKMLHMTERSVYRMAKGEQTQPRRGN